MMTISIAIQKGGSGKTTTCVNLAAALRDRGHRVLLIDLDPQANLTQALGMREEKAHSIYHVIKAHASGQQVDIKDIVEHVHGFDAVPSSIELASAELELVSTYGREHILKHLLEPVNHYDFVFIDCPPAIGMLTVNALVASDKVLIPLQAEFLPMKGITGFMKTFDLIKKQLNPHLEVLGFLLTKYERRKNLHRHILDELVLQHGNKVFNTRIRNNVALAQAQEKGVDIFAFKKAANGAMDYNSLADELLQKLGEKH